MKIAYLVHFRGGSTSGILRKVASQVSTWARLGVDVGLFVSTAPESVEAWRTLPQTKKVLTPPTGWLALLRERESLMRSAEAWHPDVLYTRHGLTYPGLVSAARRRTCIVEVNGDDLAEARLNSASRYHVTRATRGAVLRRAAGLVFVTNELAAKPTFATYGRPNAIIGNGIDLQSIEHTSAPDNDEPRLVFVGHPRSPWHGLDQLELLADERPTWHIDVIGPDPAELQSTHANMTIHGSLEAPGYRRILETADIAVGSLAMFRAGIEEASTLKVREYLAAGLPTVIGYQDTDFMDGAEFLLRIRTNPTRSVHPWARSTASWTDGAANGCSEDLWGTWTSPSRSGHDSSSSGASPMAEKSSDRFGISVVLVSWNSAAVLPACLESVAGSSPLPTELLVVDNNSVDDSVAIVGAWAKTYPRVSVRVLENSTNAGFAPAVNQAIEVSSQPLVCLLNPDVRLLPDTMARLTEALERLPNDVSVVGAKLLRASGDDLDPTPLIDSAGMVMTRDGRHFDRGSGLSDDGRFDTEEDVFGITGALALFRRDALEASRVDGQVLDEDFFAYREDADLAWRLQGFGYRARYVPSAVAYHRRTVTPERRRSLPTEINYHSVKNRFLLRIHHADRSWLLRFGFRSLVRDVMVLGARPDDRTIEHACVCLAVDASRNPPAAATKDPRKAKSAPPAAP